MNSCRLGKHNHRDFAAVTLDLRRCDSTCVYKSSFNRVQSVRRRDFRCVYTGIAISSLASAKVRLEDSSCVYTGFRNKKTKKKTFSVSAKARFSLRLHWHRDLIFRQCEGATRGLELCLHWLQKNNKKKKKKHIFFSQCEGATRVASTLTLKTSHSCVTILLSSFRILGKFVRNNFSRNSPQCDILAFTELHIHLRMGQTFGRIKMDVSASSQA